MRPGLCQAPGDFLTHLCVPVLQYRTVVFQQWCNFFQVWGRFRNRLLSFLLIFGELGANLVSIWDQFDFVPKFVPASRQIQKQMCPHASGVMPVGARRFSYTFWCTCAAISYSCVPTVVPFLLSLGTLLK